MKNEVALLISPGKFEIDIQNTINWKKILF